MIRHAIAEEREDFAATGRDDSERPLTEEGRSRMRRVCAGLRELVPSIDVLASSPYTRAVQTAEIVADRYGIEPRDVVREDALVPDAALDSFIRWIQRRSRDGIVAVVGHEPHLGLLVTWLMTGFAESRVEMKKGGVALLDFDGQPGAGLATLRWLLAPGQLRRIG